VHRLDGPGGRRRVGGAGIDVARRFGLLGLIVVLAALSFGALLSGLQALKAMG
jgi:hypothetical protein